MKAQELRKNLIRYYFDLQNTALDHGLLGAQKDYCQFIIIGRGRTGSTLLRTSLANHGQVMMYGELFRIPGQVVWNSKFGNESDQTQESVSADPEEFLDTKVYRSYPKNIKAVGFKIFYYHAENGDWKRVWNYLAEKKELHIIHNKRRNILETQLSDKRAWQTGQWADKKKSGDKNNQQPLAAIHLDYEELKLWFTLTRDWENNIDSTFSDHPKIDVYYEDLAQDYSAELDRIQKFLGLNMKEINPITRKQARGTLTEQISNYSALKAQFKGSPWSEFFSE